MYGAVEAADLLGDADTSAQVYALLSPFAQLPMMAGLSVVCFGSTQHALGVASLTMGEVDRAIEHFRTAVDQNVALRHQPAAVLSRVRLGKALALRDGTGDAAAAQRELADGRRDAATLGMAVRESTVSAPMNRIVCRRVGRTWQLDLATGVCRSSTA